MGQDNKPSAKPNDDYLKLPNRTAEITKKPDNRRRANSEIKWELDADLKKSNNLSGELEHLPK
jgi:hypothetical protein